MNVCLGIYACTMYIKFCAIDRALGRKIMEDLTGPGRERVDRLPLLVSGQNIVKLLSVPKLHDGTAVTMMNSVVDSMDEWLRNHIKVLRYDGMEHGYEGWSLHFAGERDWQIATKFSLSLSCDRDYAGESFRDLWCFEVTKHGFFWTFQGFLASCKSSFVYNSHGGW